MRRKKRTWCYFGITIIFTFLGYYKCQSNMRSDETQSPWSRTPVTKSVIHHSTDGLAHTQRTVATTIDPTTNLIKDTMIYGRTDKENSSTSLLQYISNFEQMQLSLPRGMDRAAVITGALNVIDRDTPLYRKAFELHNFTVIHNKNNFKVSLDKSWVALLCLSYSDVKDCFENLQFSNLKNFQKISHIPGIRSVLGKKESLCQITSVSTMKTKNSFIGDIQLAPSCWVMPQQYEEFASVTTDLGSDNKMFFIKPVSSASGWRSRVVNLGKPEDIEYIRRFQQHSGIIQHYFNNQLVISDRPFSIRMFVLVTSMSPLRAYMYNEGIVYFRTSQHKSHHRLSTKDPWCFTQLKEHLQSVRGPQAAEAVSRNMQLAIVQLLLRAETHVAGYYGTIGGDPITGNLFRCLNCYQLLGIDLVINTSLHVMISEVNGQPNMREAFQEDVPVLNSIKEQILYDMIGLVFNTGVVASNVTKIIDQLNVGLTTVGCKSRQKHCLTNDDLHYLLSWQRELINLGNFKQLYPTPDLPLHKNLLASSHVQDTNLRDTLLGHEPTLDKRHKFFHNTFELQDLILDFMKLSGNKQNSEFKSADASSFQHVKLPLVPPKLDHPIQHQNEEYFGALIGNVLGGNKVSTSPCSNSLDQMPYLSELVVSPGRLQPTFVRQITSYKLIIPHEVPMVSISASPAHCSCVAKFSTDHMTNLRMDIYNHVNWTFGIGDTTVRWLLLDSGHNQPWVINQYSIIITRQMLSLYEPAFTMNQSHKVCALTQDCSLKVYPDRPCGLYELGDSTWKNFKLRQSKNPDCKDGVDTGHWMLPCVHCTKPSTCFWREAVWTPKYCKHIRKDQNQSKSCTSNKKILLIGDSTCAGIMYYLIEKINGSLLDWTDIQTSVTYKNINNERTTFSFAYYPQFWLPKNQRLVYEETLDGLLKQNEPLSNDSSTVLIIGGVQWMNHHHIKVTHRLLNSVGLTGITVIIKGLSSGFYQPSTGIKWISPEGQRKLVKLQESLSQLTSQFGYMIDTLGMTITRHKHFLHGNCACQFHKVVHSSLLDTKESSDQDKVSHDQRGYHVLGDINAVYSEIALNIICKNIT